MRLRKLFVLNEHVALFGRWHYDFFGVVFVGATNVGTVKVNSDSVSIAPKTLSRDKRADLHFLSSQLLQALCISVHGRPPPPRTYTECLGNTIVLVSEAPETFEFTVKPGRRVQVGNRLGDVPGAVTTVGSVNTKME